TEMAADRFSGGTELASLPNVSCPRGRSDMRGKALVFGFSFAAVALMCLAREPAAQTQQGTQPSQTDRVPPDMLRGDMMGGGMMGGGMHAEHPRGPRMLMRMIFSLMDAD